MKSAVNVTLRRRSSGVSGLETPGGRGGLLVPAGTKSPAPNGAGRAGGADGAIGAGEPGERDRPGGIANARTTSLGTGLGPDSTARSWASSFDLPSGRASTT